MYDDLYSRSPDLCVLFASQIKAPIMRSSGIKYACKTGGKTFILRKATVRKTILDQMLINTIKLIHDNTSPVKKCR